MEYYYFKKTKMSKKCIIQLNLRTGKVMYLIPKNGPFRLNRDEIHSLPQTWIEKSGAIKYNSYKELVANHFMELL